MDKRYSDIRQKPQVGTLFLITIFHLALLVCFVWALTPEITRMVNENVFAAIDIEQKPPEEEKAKPDIPEPVPDQGAAGDPGQKVIPREVIAPEPEVPLPNDNKAPKNTSDGSDNSSGAASQGGGPGGGGDGEGLGSGNTGDGRGGRCKPSKPRILSGGINTARDFATPPGGRRTRFGKSVTVRFTVTTGGRARNCSVVNSGVDVDATARVCPLVMQKIRFQPAQDVNCKPVEKPYGYRVVFSPR